MRKTLTKKQKREFYSEIGRLGGQANVRKNGREHMSELGKIGMKSRWSKNKTA